MLSYWPGLARLVLDGFLVKFHTDARRVRNLDVAPVDDGLGGSLHLDSKIPPRCLAPVDDIDGLLANDLIQTALAASGPELGPSRLPWRGER